MEKMQAVRDISNSSKFIAGDVTVENGNVHVGDVITNVYNFAEYRDLKRQLDRIIQELAEANEAARSNPGNEYIIGVVFKKDKERQEIQERIDAFAQEIFKLANELSRIKVDTQRLKLARKHFLEGDLSSLRRILDPLTMEKELDEILSAQETIRTNLLENDQLLLGKSDEYLILALVTAINFELSERYEKTVSYFDQSLRAKKTSSNLHEFALFLDQHNQIEKATPLMEEALAIDRLLAVEGSEIAFERLESTLNNLSILYKNNHELRKSMQAATEAVRICEKLTEVNSERYRLKTAHAKANLATAYFLDNLSEQALPLLFEAQQQYEKSQSLSISERDSYGKVLQNIATIHKERHQPDRAIEFFDKAIAIYVEISQEMPNVYVPNLAHVVDNKADLLHKCNRIGEALELYDQVIAIERELAKSNPRSFLEQLAATLTSVADIYGDKGRVPEAVAYYEEAAEILNLVQSGNELRNLAHVARNSNNLGTLYLENGSPDKGRHYLESALSMFTRLSHDSAQLYENEVSRALNNLGIVYKQKGQYEQAITRFEEALKVRRRLAVQDADRYLPEVAITLGNMANAYSEAGNDDAAEPHYVEAAIIRHKLAELNPMEFRPKLAHSASNLALFYTFNKPRKDQAIVYAVEAIQSAYPYKDHLPMARKYLVNAAAVLTHWGVDPTTISLDNSTP